MDAYVYLRVQPGKVRNVAVELAGKHGVRQAVAVVGDWDVMVAAEGADLLDVATNVLSQIHPIQGVLRTRTAPVVPLDTLGIVGGGWAMPPTPLQRQGEACFVHIKAQVGAVSGIVEQLGELEDVSGVAVIAGDYDVIAEISMPWERAGRVILESIHGLPGILDTNTLVAMPLSVIQEPEEDRDQFSAWQ